MFFAVLGSVVAQLEGKTGSFVVVTDSSQPPTIHGFDTLSYERVVFTSYTLEDLVEKGISRQGADGTNRTLRPHGVVVHEGSLVDSIYVCTLAIRTHRRRLVISVFPTDNISICSGRMRARAPSSGFDSTARRSECSLLA